MKFETSSHTNGLLVLRQRLWGVLRPQPLQPTISVLGHTLDRKRALVVLSGVFLKVLIFLVRHLPALYDAIYVASQSVR